jgi:ABC-type oligopeptide transport system substrate-binding subunit
LEEFPLRSTGAMQAFAPNLRRDKFKDDRVRRALNLAYDFEDMNRTLFYGAYKRINSFFYGTELASTGLPQGQELAVLETLRGKVPDRVFTTPYTNPVGGNPEAVRANLREADRLLKEAGWELRGGRRVHAKTGETLALELLGNDPNDERVFLVYKPALERLGVGVTVRIVDQAQYVNRVRAFDFDVIIDVWAQSLSPGNEQREFWGSSADRPGSRNTLGIKDEAIDALTERIVFAKDRSELLATTKALDRVLLHHHFVVPQFWSDTVRAARWDRLDALKNSLNTGPRDFRRSGGTMRPRPPRREGFDDGVSLNHLSRVGEGCFPPRRSCRANAAALATTLLPHEALAETETESHGLSTFGELKYPADFKHFDYVNPNAPKGGTLAQQIKSATGNQNFDTFNTLHIYVLRGDGAAGMGATSTA